MNGDYDQNGWTPKPKPRSEEHELFAVLRQIRMDATAIQAKVTTLMNMLSGMNLPQLERTMCPRAGCKALVSGERGLAFHIQNVHGGPLVPMSKAEVEG